jgi:nitroreductase
MELSDVVRSRRMVRSYDADRPVDDAAVRRLLAAAVRAPSAGHSQGWDFLVLRTAAERDRFWSVTAGPGEPDRWLRGLRAAPLLIVCLSDEQAYRARYAEPDKARSDRAEPEDRAAPHEAAPHEAAPDEAALPAWPVPYWHVDTGMAALLLLLTAVDLGLGACFFGVPAARHAAVLEAFGVPPGRVAVGVVSVGHPAPDRRSPSLRRGRRGVEEVVHRGAW